MLQLYIQPITKAAFSLKCSYKLALLGFYCCFLSACDTPYYKSEFPELTFTHRPQIHINVSKILIINEYEMPFKSPNIEHLVPVAPSAAAERWAADILKPIGNQGTAQFIIRHASLTREKLKTKSGISGVFSIDQSDRFKTTLKAKLELLKENRRIATADAQVSRSQTSREDASPNQRGQLWYGMVEGLMGDFDFEMRRQIKKYLSQYLR